MEAIGAQCGEKSLPQVVDEESLLKNVKMKSIPEDVEKMSQDRILLSAIEFGLSQSE